MSPKTELILGTVLLGVAVLQLLFGAVLTNEWKLIKRNEHPFIFWAAILVTSSIGSIVIIQAILRPACPDSGRYELNTKDLGAK